MAALAFVSFVEMLERDVDPCSSSMLTGGVTLGESLDFPVWTSPVVNRNNGTSQSDEVK